jgi:hypothetical protein
MPSPDELRAALAAAREDFKSAVAEATARWDQAIGDEWSPRKAAEHVAGAEIYFATEVCKACGYPGLDTMSPSFATANDGLIGFAEATAKSDGRLKYVSEKDLLMPHERMGSVADVMLMNVTHLREHAAQIRGA